MNIPIPKGQELTPIAIQPNRKMMGCYQLSMSNIRCKKLSFSSPKFAIAYISMLMLCAYWGATQFVPWAYGGTSPNNSWFLRWKEVIEKINPLLIEHHVYITKLHL